MFPKIGVITPKSSILDRLFHYFHHPFWGVFPLFLETPKKVQLLSQLDLTKLRSRHGRGGFVAHDAGRSTRGDDSPRFRAVRSLEVRITGPGSMGFSNPNISHLWSNRWVFQYNSPKTQSQRIHVWYNRWWFQIFFILAPIRGRFPCWLIFFRWIESTNQICIFTYPAY